VAECVFENEEPGHQPLTEEVFEYIGCVWCSVHEEIHAQEANQLQYVCGSRGVLETRGRSLHVCV
jgi:hypothetical protein